MNKRTALPIVIACTALGCGSESGGEGPDFSVPAYSGTTPSTTTAPAAGQNPGAPVAPVGQAGQGRV